jgi:acyl-CoA dehydrogenase
LLAQFQQRVATDQLLLASATTEVGVGGDVRTSRCAVETTEGRFHLEKQAMVISYGEYADAVLATARRDPDSAPSDQVLVVCDKPDVNLEAVGDWNVLGFRGTCSLGFKLTADGDASYVLPVPYADISSTTMLPVSHLLWSSLWLGMAGSAVDKATKIVQAQARSKPDVKPPAALRLAELLGTYQLLADTVASNLRRYEATVADPESGSTMRFAVAMNGLKVNASTLLVDIVGKALVICGMAGYRDGGELSLGRVLRDAHGSMLMVNNDRILDHNAQLALVQRGVER